MADFAVGVGALDLSKSEIRGRAIVGLDEASWSWVGPREGDVAVIAGARHGVRRRGFQRCRLALMRQARQLRRRLMRRE